MSSCHFFKSFKGLLIHSIFLTTLRKRLGVVLMDKQVYILYRDSGGARRYNWVTVFLRDGAYKTSFKLQLIYALLFTAWKDRGAAARIKHLMKVRIAHHVWANSHAIDFDNASIIDKGGFRTRKILEAWHSNSCPLPGQYNILFNKHS